MVYRRLLARGILATCVLAVALTTLVARQGPPRGQQRQRGPNPELLLEMAADKLGLSPDQESALRETFTTHRGEMLRLQQQLRSARDEVGQRVEAEVFDESAIREAALAAGEVGADIEVARAAIRQKVRETLTSEQWEEWQALRLKLRGAMGRRGRGPAGFGPEARGSR